jgi:hypothetical protein
MKEANYLPTYISSLDVVVKSCPNIAFSAVNTSGNNMFQVNGAVLAGQPGVPLASFLLDWQPSLVDPPGRSPARELFPQTPQQDASNDTADPIPHANLTTVLGSAARMIVELAAVCPANIQWIT